MWQVDWLPTKLKFPKINQPALWCMLNIIFGSGLAGGNIFYGF